MKKWLMLPPLIILAGCDKALKLEGRWAISKAIVGGNLTMPKHEYIDFTDSGKGYFVGAVTSKHNPAIVHDSFTYYYNDSILYLHYKFGEIATMQKWRIDCKERTVNLTCLNCTIDCLYEIAAPD